MDDATCPNGLAGKDGEPRSERRRLRRALASESVAGAPGRRTRLRLSVLVVAANAGIVAGVWLTGGADGPLAPLLAPALVLAGAFLSGPLLAILTAGVLAALVAAHGMGAGGWAPAHLAVALPLLIAASGASYAITRRVRKLLREERTVARVRRAVGSSLLLDRVYAAIHEEVARLIPVDHFALSVIHTGSDDLEIVYAAGAPIPEQATGDHIRPASPGEPGWSSVGEGRGQIAADTGLGATSRPELVASGLRSGLRAALGSPARPSGYITVRSRRPGAYSAADAELLARVAAEVSSTIDNARYHAQVVRAAGERVHRMRLVAENRELEQAREELAALNEQLEAQNQIVRASRERLLAADESAKRAVAEELHGGVQTKLLVLWATLGGIRDDLEGEDADLPSLRASLDQVIDDLDRLREEDIRLLSHRLHPSIVRVSALAGLGSLRDFYGGNLDVQLQVGESARALEPPGASRIPEQIRLALHRVADAALGNVLKHAGADRCVVRWDYDRQAGALKLSVIDDGVGFRPDARAPSGLGLVTISDYVDALGGTLSVTSLPGEGTRVDVAIPFSEDDAPADAPGGGTAEDRAIGTVLNVHWARPHEAEREGWSEAG